MDYKKYQSIPNNLRQHRTERGLKQDQVAAALGLKNKTLISRWERGRSIPSLITAVRLSVIYATPINVLFVSLMETIKNEYSIKH
ncbi:MAG: helix-turn-helix transcriptional regulator [Ignavibacteriaceae bacterium]